MSWWSRAWWLDFIITPLAKEFGLSEVYKMSIPEAMLMKESIGSTKEMERYYHWKYEQDYKLEKEQNPTTKDGKSKYMKVLQQSESDYKKVNSALKSSDNYTAFLMSSRGYTPNAIAK